MNHIQRPKTKMGPRGWAMAALFLQLLSSGAALPPAEKILPDDTLVVLTAPDFAKLREIYKSSPQSAFWKDPAMKPFKDKFLSRWNDEFVKPLERDLNLRFDDYTGLPQGQITFALTQNGWQGEDEDTLGFLLLVDTKDKSAQLKSNLADLRRKWVDAGKSIKTEKIRDLEFSALTLSSNDVPKTWKTFFPDSGAPDAAAEGDSAKPRAKSRVFIGQFESMLIVGNSAKVIEKVAVRLGGGSIPSLGEQSTYQANHQSLFRDTPAYAWVNVKAFVDVLARKIDKKDSGGDASIKPEKVLAATGISGLKSVALTFQHSSDGSLFQLFLGVPEAGRQGLFKILAGEAKPANPPAFVPADAVKFQRWRIDGQKTWATLEKMLGDISPQWVSMLNMLLTTANNAIKEKDPGFDVRKNLIGNLGDDLISYEKTPRGTSAQEVKSPPSLFLVASPNPDQLAAALKNIMGFLNQQGSAPAEREFLGRKIYSMPLPNLPFPGAESPRPATPRNLNYAASGGYVAMSLDVPMLEEYLRSSESQAKSLREATGLVEASQKVAGPGTSLFGYENLSETMRVMFESFRKDPGALTNATGFSAIPGMAAMPGPQKNFREWMDFSLLPPFERIAKYFSFTVYSGGSTVEGLSFKMFAPVPPQLKQSK
jgi:hypothetical protein